MKSHTKGVMCTMKAELESLSSSKSDILLLLVANLCLFAPTIQDLTGFALIDEISTVILGVVACRIVIKEKLSIREIPVLPLLLIGVLILIGVLGNILNNSAPRYIGVAIDIFTCVKYFLCIVSSIVVFKYQPKVGRYLVAEAKLLISIMMIFGIINLVTDIGMGAEGRFGIPRAFSFIFPHPTYLAAACAGLIPLLLQNNRKNTVFIIGACILITLTLRAKALPFAVIILLYCIYRVYGIKRYLVPVVVILTIAAGAYVLYQGVFYFGGGAGGVTAREALLRTSIDIANRMFPIGVGFASFGSAITATSGYYSQYYYEYGLNHVLGLSADAPTYMSDSFWPTVFAQFGWIGTVVYVSTLIVLMMKLRKICNDGQSLFICSLPIIYLLLASSSESSFFNPQSIWLAISTAVSVGLLTNINLEKESLHKGISQ